MTLHTELSHVLNTEPPQRAELGKIAMDEIASGLKKLASLGYNFHLVRSDAAPSGAEYPKVLYRGQESLTVVSEEEEKAAHKDGWDVHPSLKEAKAKAKAKEEKPTQSEVKEAGKQGAAISPGKS